MIDGQFFSNEIKLILHCIKNELQNESQHEIKKLLSLPLDWEFIIKESIYHGITSFIYYELNKTNLITKTPSKSLIELKNYYYNALFRNILLWEEFCSIYDALIHAKIKVLPIKGIILVNTIYKNPGLRPMADIDILIQKDNISTTEKVLSQLGYRKNIGKHSQGYYEKQDFQMPFFKTDRDGRRIFCEIHWNLMSSRPNKVILPRLWQRTKEQIIDKKKILTLSPEDTLFSLALHLRRYNIPFSLRYIYDIYKLIKIYKNKFDWDYIINESNKNRLRSTLYFALFSGYRLLDMPIPSRILKELYPGPVRKKALKFLISKYTFSPDLLKKSIKNSYLYVFLRLLLYDRLRDFVSFIIFIPIEEFARFYSLPLNSKKTLLFYHFRIIYILCESFLNIVAIIIRNFKRVLKT